VSVFYDPMIAKVISYAPSRRQAAGVLADALARTRIHGVRTNRDLLVNVLRHPAFLDGATDTAFFDTHGLAELAAPLADRRAVELSAVAAALADAAQNRRTATVFSAAPSGWRNLASGCQAKQYSDSAGETHEVRYRFTRTGVELPGHDGVTLEAATPGRVVLAVDGVERAFDVARYGEQISSIRHWARCTSLRCRVFRIRTTPSPRARCWRPCRARCCASARRSATPSPPGSR